VEENRDDLHSHRDEGQRLHGRGVRHRPHVHHRKRRLDRNVCRRFCHGFSTALLRSLRGRSLLSFLLHLLPIIDAQSATVTILKVVIDNAYGLHKCVAYRTPNKLKTKFFERLAHGITLRACGAIVGSAFDLVYLRFATRVRPKKLRE